DVAFLGLGETQSSDFRMRVAITRNNWYGAVGVFWNYHDEVDDSGAKVSPCECICLTAPLPAPQEVIVERKSYAFHWIKGVLRPSVKANTIKGVKIDVPEGREFVLEVEVIDGFLGAVRVQSQDYQELHEAPDFVHAPRRNRLAWCGVMHTGGVSAF